MRVRANLGGGGGGADYGYIPWSELNGQSEYTVTLGYEPKKISWVSGSPSSYIADFFYDKNRDSSHFFGVQNTISASGAADANNAIGNTSYYWGALKSINTNGFTLAHFVQSYHGSGIYWFASKD